VGQPVLELPPGASDEESQRLREMALVLKLARRVGVSRGPRGPRPGVFQWDQDGAKNVEPAEPAGPDFSPQRLFERLLDPQAPAWATLDTSGHLLFSADRTRLAELFAQPEVDYQTLVRDGHTVLVRRDRGQAPLEAWLERNPDNPYRPWVVFRQAGQEYRPSRSASGAEERSVNLTRGSDAGRWLTPASER
jgi:hypothetical protein